SRATAVYVGLAQGRFGDRRWVKLSYHFGRLANGSVLLYSGLVLIVPGMSEGGSCESSSRNVGRFTPVVSCVRESVQPSRLSAPISCCFVCSKTLLMRAQDPVLLARGQRLGRGQLIAGFEVSINHNCRFWVSTEAAASRLPLTTLD